MAMVMGRRRSDKGEGNQRGSPSNRRRAAAAVEFALVALPLMLLLVGLIDYGMVFFKTQHVTQAARAGARRAAMPGATVNDVNAAVTAWLDEANLTAAGPPVITPSNWADNGYTKGSPIKVQVTVASTELSLIRSGLIPVPDNLVASASMAKEGP